MQGRHALLFNLILLVSCSDVSSEPPQQDSPATSRAQPTNRLSTAQKNKIGRKIWQNESGGQVSGLTAWNKGENFPSLGIGHFIWYPAGVRGPFTESWPQFVRYAQNRGAHPPAVATQAACPWRTREQFQSQQNSATMVGLRKWLAANVSLQTDFIIAKSNRALGKVLAAAPATDRDRVRTNYQRVATTPNGMYALIDYVNFKGEGINPKERYRGQGWGLLQVLQEMRAGSGGQAAAQEFSRAAATVLQRRIKNSPPARGESRWRAGWMNRTITYARPL